MDFTNRNKIGISFRHDFSIFWTFGLDIELGIYDHTAQFIHSDCLFH